jgi:hypothetical protein
MSDSGGRPSGVKCAGKEKMLGLNISPTMRSGDAFEWPEEK